MIFNTFRKNRSEEKPNWVAFTFAQIRKQGPSWDLNQSNVASQQPHTHQLHQVVAAMRLCSLQRIDKYIANPHALTVI